MNILFISHMYPNKYNFYSGIFVHKQVLALKKQYGESINIKVISPIPYTPLLLVLFSEKYRKYRNMPYRDNIEGIEILYPRVFLLPRNLNFTSSGRSFYYGLASHVKKLEHLGFKIDLIHSHVALPDGVCAKLIKKKFKIPYIITVHGQDMNYTINKSNNLKKKVLDAINNSEKTIFVSEKLRGIACKYIEDRKKLIVVHNGINIEELAKDTEDIKRKLEGKRMLLSVSNLINTKGHDLTIKAFASICKKYNDFKLVIIGTGIEEENLKRLSINLGVGNDVIFTGQLPNSEVMKYIKECEIFVLPSWKEGFGVAYIEAMVNSKCVIGCKGEGISDVISHGVNGILVEPRDLDSLINNLGMLIENNELTEKIGQRAAHDIRNNFTWKHNAEKMMGVYTEVIKKCR